MACEKLKAQFLIVDNLVAPVIIGMDVLTQHFPVTISFKGNKEPLKFFLATNSKKCYTYALIPGVDINKIKRVLTKPRRSKNIPFLTEEINRILKQSII